MRYIALLRGINVGGNHKVEMARLRKLLEGAGCTEVTTFINSGNVQFRSALGKKAVESLVGDLFLKSFPFEIPTLIKTEAEVKKIVAAVPRGWTNDDIWRCDIAFLFPAIDRKSVLAELPLRAEWIDVRYVKGAIYWRQERSNYGKSHLNKLISNKLYKLMTIRNVHTARFLAGQAKKKKT